LWPINAGLVAPARHAIAARRRRKHQSEGGTSRIQISQTTVLFTHETDAGYYHQNSYITTNICQQLRAVENIHNAFQASSLHHYKQKIINSLINL
jgi:hypothetical protein